MIICFVDNINLKKNEIGIKYKKENNFPSINYRSKISDINKIMYYILYYKLEIENEEFFIKWYFKNNNKLSEKEKQDYKIQEFKRFGK